ncbi:NAD-dependent epimerase/dehydratase family protein [bacterium]|nr:NAD-dependent epimerase/dehydratase family protein [bacterium]
MRFAGRTVLVTGGAGFVGSNLVVALLREGAKVKVVDNFFTGNLENLKEVYDKIELLECSVSSSQIASFLSDVEYIFHLATVNITAAVEDPLLEQDTNVKGTVNLVYLCKDLPIKRFVYTSSVSIYGNAKVMPIPEDAYPQFTSIYPAGKYAGEAYCQAFYSLYNIPITILRYSNVYGPRQSPKNPYSGVISKFFFNALRQKPLQIYGSGEQTRDFVYVDDAVEATLRAAILPQAVGEVFNIATGKETSINELADIIWSIVNPGKKPEKVYLPKRKIDSIERRVLNIDKARKLLSWSPKTELKEGLMLTYEWFKEQNFDSMAYLENEQS